MISRIVTYTSIIIMLLLLTFTGVTIAATPEQPDSWYVIYYSGTLGDIPQVMFVPRRDVVLESSRVIAKYRNRTYIFYGNVALAEYSAQEMKNLEPILNQ